MRSNATLLEAIEGRLSSVLGVSVRACDLEPVSMGASKAIWRFTAIPEDRERMHLVLRADPIENPKPDAMALEAAVLRAASDQQVRVPRVIDSGNGSDGIGSPFVIMTAIEGETLPPRILRDPSTATNADALTYELGQSIAGIHRIPATEVPGLRLVDDVAEYEALYRSGPTSPAMELTWRWLHANRPQGHPPTVVHGDFRHGNIIVDDGHLAAVLDWELSHIGDPLEDLGWICTKAWRFGAPKPVGGFGDIDDLLDGYESVAGWRPEISAVRWWSIFGSVRWGAMCRRQAARHLEGDEESLELALIGRRFAENEFDVLIALGHAEPSAATPPSSSPGSRSSMFGTPTVDDILDAAIMEAGKSGEYRDRLLKNALNVVRRELSVGAALESRLAEALTAAGFTSEDQLATAIRDGAPLTEELLTAVRRGVEGRLLVWNPKHLGYPAPGNDFRVTADDGGDDRG